MSENEGIKGHTPLFGSTNNKSFWLEYYAGKHHWSGYTSVNNNKGGLKKQGHFKTFSKHLLS